MASELEKKVTYAIKQIFEQVLQEIFRNIHVGPFVIKTPLPRFTIAFLEAGSVAIVEKAMEESKRDVVNEFDLCCGITLLWMRRSKPTVDSPIKVWIKDGSKAPIGLQKIVKAKLMDLNVWGPPERV